MPFARRIDLNISGRYDHYSDFGDIKIEVRRDLGSRRGPEAAGQLRHVVRGAAILHLRPRRAERHRRPKRRHLLRAAERHAERAARQISGGPDDPGCNAPGQATCILGTATIAGMRLDGANPDVKPATGMTWAFGADFAPRFLPGLTANVTYWHTSLKGTSGSPPLSIVINSDAFHDLLKIYPNGATAAEIEAYRGGRRQRSPLSSGPIYFGLDFRNYNVYTVYVEGIDFDVHYRHQFDWGSIRGGIAGTYKTRFDQTAADGEPVFSVLNRNRFNGTFPSIRTDMRADISMDVGPVSAALFANYTGGFTFWGSTALNPVTSSGGIPNGGGDKVRVYTTFDANLTYKFGKSIPGEPSLFVQVQNLFDTYPPFENTSQGFDNFVGFVLGRVVNVGVRVKFQDIAIGWRPRPSPAWPAATRIPTRSQPHPSGSLIMKNIIALALVALVAAISSVICAHIQVPVWTMFIGWIAFVAGGMSAKTAAPTFVCSILGVILGFIGAAIIGGGAAGMGADLALAGRGVRHRVRRAARAVSAIRQPGHLLLHRHDDLLRLGPRAGDGDHDRARWRLADRYPFRAGRGDAVRPDNPRCERRSGLRPGASACPGLFQRNAYQE